MANSETFGVEKGHGEKIVGWLNEQSKIQIMKFQLKILEILKCFHGWGMFKLQEK